ncbi:MAG: rod shape-determining protein MreD [Thermoleophilia bacterium]|nr:rod shape-determining protein MreD [Thermoleophilia bacterium]
MSSSNEKHSRILRGNGGPVTSAATKEGPLYFLRVFTLIMLAVVVQTTIAPHITVLGAKPDSALVLVVCVALIRGPVWGATVGFVTGLLLDVALVQTLGISSFLFTLAGYFSGRYGEGADMDSWIPPLITVFISTLVVQLLNAVMMYLLGVEASVSFVLIRILLPTAILNGLLTPPLFVAARWWLGGERMHAFFAE